jgi:hypothetical protein
MIEKSRPLPDFDYSKFDMDKINANSKVYVEFDEVISFELLKQEFKDGVTFDQVIKYFKGKVANIDVFNTQIISELRLLRGCDDIADKLEAAFPMAKPFTYEEAFKLENVQFRAGVFTTIDVTEMVNNLGKTMIKTDGIEVTRKTFDTSGNRTEDVTYHNVYETYEIKGDKIGLEDELMYAVRCWCTSTNEEHWIWIEEKYKNEPLDAIASTFRIHENVIPYIKELKRQGDIMLVEMKEEVTPSGEIVPLSKKQYFDLLTVET